MARDLITSGLIGQGIARAAYNDAQAELRDEARQRQEYRDMRRRYVERAQAIPDRPSGPKKEMFYPEFQDGMLRDEKEFYGAVSIAAEIEEEVFEEMMAEVSEDIRKAAIRLRPSLLNNALDGRTSISELIDPAFWSSRHYDAVYENNKDVADRSIFHNYDYLLLTEKWTELQNKAKEKSKQTASIAAMQAMIRDNKRQIQKVRHLQLVSHAELIFKFFSLMRLFGLICEAEHVRENLGMKTRDPRSIFKKLLRDHYKKYDENYYGLITERDDNCQFFSNRAGVDCKFFVTEMLALLADKEGDSNPLFLMIIPILIAIPLDHDFAAYPRPSKAPRDA